MRLYDLRVSKHLRVYTAAFFAVLLYLVLGIVLNLLQSLIDPTGESYNLVYGILQFILGSLYWIVYNYFIFSREGKTDSLSIVLYLILNFIPILVFTLATTVILYLYPTTDFTLSWNLLTWVIAPTLFWYLPFSYVYYTFGFYINIPVFMGLMLIYLLLIQILGIILGLARRAHLVEQEEAQRRQRERSRQMRKNPRMAFESVKNEQEPPTEMIMANTVELENEKLYTGTNPFNEIPVDDHNFRNYNGEVVHDPSTLSNSTQFLHQDIDFLKEESGAFNLNTKDIEDIIGNNEEDNS